MSPSSKGFTLIELLVVITIVSVVLTLTGGLLIGATERAELRSEYLNLEARFEFTAQDNMLHGRKVYFLASSDKLFYSESPILFEESEDIASEFPKLDFIRFDHLYFDGSQFFSISKHGYSSQQWLSLRYGKSQREMPLPWLPLVEGVADEEK
jgi:prepilin-type N-terminal cleavage/methylation domain-containing protein